MKWIWGNKINRARLSAEITRSSATLEEFRVNWFTQTCLSWDCVVVTFAWSFLRSHNSCSEKFFFSPQGFYHRNGGNSNTGFYPSGRMRGHTFVVAITYISSFNDSSGTFSTVEQRKCFNSIKDIEYGRLLLLWSHQLRCKYALPVSCV